MIEVKTPEVTVSIEGDAAETLKLLAELRNQTIGETLGAAISVMRTVQLHRDGGGKVVLLGSNSELVI